MERNLLRYSYSCFLLFLLTHSIYAQHSNKLAIQFKDSVECDSDSYFLYASLKWVPENRVSSSVYFHVTMPPGWRIMGDSLFQNSHFPTHSSTFPLTFVRTRFTPSIWSKVNINFCDSLGIELLDTFFHIKAPAITEFQVLSVGDYFEIPDTSRLANVSILLKNLGTTYGSYQVSAMVASEVLYDHHLFSLTPGADTVLTFPVRFPNLWMGDQYHVQVKVIDTSGLVRALPLEIIRRYTKKKAHASPYKQFPISLDWGAFLVEKKIYHFSEIQSSFSFLGGAARIMYRTKTFGQLKTIERNIFLFDFENKKYFLSVGQLSTFSHFFAYGNGLHYIYRPNSNIEIGLKGILRQSSSIYTNNNFQVFVHHQYRRFRFSNQVHIDIDNRKGIDGYLIFNEFKWVQGDKWVVNVNVGAGFEEFKKIRVLQSGDLGWSAGSLVNFQHNKWQVFSEFRYTQKSYPGLNKGFRMHQHEVVYRNKRYKVSLFYQFSLNASPLLLDTVYLADAFSYNIEKSGIKMFFVMKSKELNFSSGWLRQSGLIGAQVPNYVFAESSFNWKKNKDFSFQFTSLSGYASNQSVDRSVWLTNTSFDFKFRRLGLKGFYVQSPFLRDSTTKVFMYYNRTYMFNPYTTFQLFKRVRATWRYSFSRSLFDKKTIQSAGFSMVYKNAKGDWQVQCTAMIPLSASPSNRAVTASYPFVMLSVRKDFKIPLFIKRQYYNISINAFEDMNANNLLDNGEKMLPNIRFKVNQTNFESDANGRFQLLNTDTGYYSIMMQPGPTTSGLIPASASTNLHLSKSTTLQLPIRRGYAIRGVVKLELDPYSTRTYSPENILVIITAEDGKRFTTITDSSGQFYLPMPAGSYTVSLNSEAFKGALQPLQLSFRVDLNETFSGEVNFILKERKREIKFRGN